ncbi:hypothetical protein PT2222_300038 [Paraburkholderia tropica]
MGARLPFSIPATGIRPRVLDLPPRLENFVSDKKPLRFIGEFVLWGSAVACADGKFNFAIRWVAREWTGADAAPSGLRNFGGAYATKDDAEEAAWDLLENLEEATVLMLLKLPHTSVEG